MIDRRTILLGGALHILHISGAGAQNFYHGCLISDRQARSRLRNSRTFGYLPGDIKKSSGDRDLDYALAQTLGFLSDNFSVLPGFAFSADRNAAASDSTVLGRSDGSVFMGLRLLREMLQLPQYSGAHIAAVCAHEFGHICQYKHNVIPRLKPSGYPTNKRIELHADYLAGAFAGLRKLQRSSWPAAEVALAQYNVGDNATTDRDHHGTPDERGRAVVEGFKAIYERRESFGTAFRKGIDYALSIP